MKIAITDACVFIDLHDIELTTAFFSLDLEIHTSLDVFYELHEEHRLLLSTQVACNKLIVHNLDQAERLSIFNENYPKSLSEMDKTVLHLAMKLDAMILSSDRVVRNFAKSKKLEYHGILWIFDQLIAARILKKGAACSKMNGLIASNVFYQNNPRLMLEVNERLANWKANDGI